MIIKIKFYLSGVIWNDLTFSLLRKEIKNSWMEYKTNEFDIQL